jgi:L-2-hydroxyglutarate oxidase LhgO
VIHAGIYYPPGTKKAKLCVQGKDMLYQYCKSRSIPHDNIGKIIVASTDKQLQVDLPRIQEQAAANGVSDLNVLTKSDIQYLEPEVECKGGLFSPSTGIIDSHSLMLSLLGDAERDGATLALKSSVVSTKNDDDGDIILVVDGMELQCKIVINCAGLYAGQVNKMILAGHKEEKWFNNLPDTLTKQIRQQYFAKGNYFQLQEQKNPFQHLIYPVPEKGGLGVHATLDLGGSCRFGPDVEWIDTNVDNPDDVDMSVDSKRADQFYHEIRKYWPNLEDGVLAADYAGIRPKLGHPALSSNGSPSLYADFVVEGPRDHGISGYINLCGIESPGLTASMAIAEYVSTLVD